MKRGKRCSRKSSPKQTLNLPDLDQAKSAVRLGNGLNAIGRRHSALEQWAAAYDLDPRGWSRNQARQHIGASRP